MTAPNVAFEAWLDPTDFAEDKRQLQPLARTLA
jgi:hypothetical protein